MTPCLRSSRARKSSSNAPKRTAPRIARSLSIYDARGAGLQELISSRQLIQILDSQGTPEFVGRKAVAESCYFHLRLLSISSKRGSSRNSAKSGQDLATIKEGSPIVKASCSHRIASSRSPAAKAAQPRTSGSTYSRFDRHWSSIYSASESARFPIAA